MCSAVETCGLPDTGWCALRERHGLSTGFAHVLSFLSHENGAEGVQAGGEGLTREHTTCAEEQGASDTGFHDGELTSSLKEKAEAGQN